MTLFKVLTFIVPVVLSFADYASSAPELKDGDIIFHTSRSSQSMAIQKATDSPYSHMGIVFFREGKPFVFEAVKTVQYTPLQKWIARGEGGHFVVKRLKDHVNSAESLEKLRKEAARYRGKPYDLVFEWSDDRIYCSELVWKIYDRALGVQIGRLQKLKDFNLGDAAVRQKMKERYGSKIPLDEPVISPAEMFNAPGLSIVREQ